MNLTKRYTSKQKLFGKNDEHDVVELEETKRGYRVKYIVHVFEDGIAIEEKAPAVEMTYFLTKAHFNFQKFNSFIKA